MNSSLLVSKVVDISVARRRLFPQGDVMNHSGGETRREERHSSHERLFVQIVDCEDTDLIGTTICCDSMDVSVGGMRISSEVFIPEGSQLDLWIDINSGPGKFFLTSDVKWSTSSKDGRYEFGTQLREGAATDIGEWRALQA